MADWYENRVPSGFPQGVFPAPVLSQPKERRSGGSPRKTPLEPALSKIPIPSGSLPKGRVGGTKSPGFSYLMVSVAIDKKNSAARSLESPEEAKLFLVGVWQVPQP